MNRFFIFILLMLPIGSIHGMSVWISLFNSHQVRSVVITAWNGPLTISDADGIHYQISDGRAVYANLRDGKIWLTDEFKEIGSFARIIIKGADSTAVVRVRPVSPQIEARNYEDVVMLTAEIDRIQIINKIDEDRYIAGVVEAETGQGHTEEFYKAKSIICRTYLYGNINRHEGEGFHLCDEVHCQVYKGQCKNRNTILTAVWATKNIIITDHASNPILATYHSNCGGETESAQNVWQSSLPYLVPIIDPYCSASPGARWQRAIPLNDWIVYLVNKGYELNPNVVANFNFQQERRTPNYRIGNITIPMRQIRTDWQLRSAFFSISVEEGNLIFRGRGYGHGVGLCQEGAMEMGRRGFKYVEIINYYYRDVKLSYVNTLELHVPEF